MDVAVAVRAYSFLANSQMRKTIPLSYLSVQSEAGARRQLSVA